MDRMRSLCLAAATALLLALSAGSAGAATLSVALSSDNSTCANGTYNNTNESSACSQNGGGTSDDWGIDWATAGGTSSNLVGLGSTSTMFSIDAKVAADDGGADVGQGGDRWVQGSLDFDITLTVDVDDPLAEWTVDLSQSVLGLYGLNGDGTASAVGTQDSGSAEMTNVTTVVNGNNYDVTVWPGSHSNNPSNNSSSSQQFSGNRNDNVILAGIGDAVFNVSIAFDLEAFSNDGCSGFICSSASGGEEAAVLFGLNSGVIDQDVDDYSYWGRSSGPDGYDSTWTLNVNVIPEPTTGLLVGLGLVGLAAARRR
ncbi:MAG: PEP-CTERM sorting domain-containing protein [Myxococcota bacterium]